MTRMSCLLAMIWMLSGISVQANDKLSHLPGPVAAYAEQFNKECQARGLGEAIVNENHRAGNPGPADVNGDGAPDYVIYKCMFGCSEKPFAFSGVGTPCPFGKLLLSQAGQYTEIFLPGLISRIEAGPPVWISLQRPSALRTSGNFCRDPFPDSDPVFVYELKEKRFQLVGGCPSDGPCELASAAGL